MTPFAEPVQWSWKRDVPGPDGFYHPASEEELIRLVELASRRALALRVRGSAHSVAPAIYTDARLENRPGALDLMLDRYGAVSFDDARMQVTVQAGCHLGLDPRDPTGMSSFDRSLVAQLDRRGWALPDLGGVSHQTVAGFLMTGSSGGTVRHPIERALVAVRWVDGRGRVHEAERGTDLFDAVACSMGLLGIVSTITLQCICRYDVLGREDVTPEAGCPYELYGDGEPGLEGFLRRTDYARLMWWPQEGVRGVITWQGRRMTTDDYTAETGAVGALRPKPYCVIGDVSRSPAVTRVASLAAQHGGGAFYDTLALGGHVARKLTERFPSATAAVRAARGALERRVLAPALRGMLATGEGAPQRFWGPWYEVLPMDNAMSERALPTTFTEIFVPLERTGEVVRCLRRHFDERGYDATGPYIFELYACRASRSWMHPSHGRDSLRVDVFRFGRNREEPRHFFQQFWELLAPFGYRLHWGKHMPVEARLGADHLRGTLPRWDDFLDLRRRLDPHGIFLSSYFRRALGVSS